VGASSGAHSTTFNFKNNCPDPVWPASLNNSDKVALSQTGFQLDSGASFSLDAPPAWGGHLWARHKCSTDSSGRFSCLSGDCGTGQVACNGAGGAPPTTLVEFTLQGDGGKDFYDVSCVVGFNVPVSVVPSGGSNCDSTSCRTNINARCPTDFKNNCPDPVWPASLNNSDKVALSQTGFQLDSGASFSLDAPPAWGGHLWARHKCSTDSSGRFSCLSGDCGTGQVACNGAGGAPPTTLVEFTLQGDGGKDFYDVSCVDGFNVPVSVVPSGGSNCDTTSCRTNINARCPTELQMLAPDGSVDGGDDRKNEKTNDRTIE
ncbi:unnamed protein product, partial [Musa acuminata var. zebrina]